MRVFVAICSQVTAQGGSCSVFPVKKEGGTFVDSCSLHCHVYLAPVWGRSGLKYMNIALSLISKYHVHLFSRLTMAHLPWVWQAK